MDDQKMETILNLALDASDTERQKSENLNVGYNAQERTWQVIVRCHGAFPAHPGWTVTQLSGGYAIVTVPQSEVGLLAALPQVEYVEKPKRLYFSADQGRQASCVSALQTAHYNLFGEGVLIALIDSGVDYFHPDFRTNSGGTRIAAIWDQTAQPDADRFDRPPAGFSLGVEYTKERIDEALAADTREAALQIVPERDSDGHGTNVLGIAAGNGRASGGRFRGVAPLADILVVKLASPEEGGFPRTTEVMQAVEYAVRKAQELSLPVVVNLSFGNTYGSHRGLSLLETYLSQMADQWKTVIVAGSGNEGNSGGHFSGKLQPEEGSDIEFTVGEYEPTLNLQLWKNFSDEFLATLIHPSGQTAGPFGQEAGAFRHRLGDTELLVYCGEPSPYQGLQELYFDFLAAGEHIDSGTWRLALEPRRIVSGRFHLWMPDRRARGANTRFLRPTPDTTLTIPSTASRLICVGAYDSRRVAYAPFSGRGWEAEPFFMRPDLAAPGVDITTTIPGGSYAAVTGTSFAVPFVAGAAALLMEWGIVEGNDPYLYGEKLRALLRRGARQIAAETAYPNPKLGYGTLCARESLQADGI